jgi:hypothetical protein
MSLKRSIFIEILLIAIVGCHNPPDKVIAKPLPKNLDEAIAYLNKDWNFYEKFKFKHQSEEDAAVSLHFTTGLWIRNNWIHGNRDPSLIKYLMTIRL